MLVRVDVDQSADPRALGNDVDESDALDNGLRWIFRVAR